MADSDITEKEVADDLYESLRAIEKVWTEGEMPTVEEIMDLDVASECFLVNLAVATDIWASGGFPTLDELREMADEAGRLVANLKEAAELQAA